MKLASTLHRMRDAVFTRQEYRVDGEPQARMIKWTVLSTPLFKIFFHRFNGPDWTLDPHDHPADFISIGLKGSYTETVYDEHGQKLYDKVWQAPWIRTFPASHIHRTSDVGPRGAYTVCFATAWEKNWGFVFSGGWMPWRDYVRYHRRDRSDRVPR
jgi:hypothetical protein